MDACRVGIVGVDGRTGLLLELLEGNDRFALAAVCDRRGDVLREYESRGRQVYDDPREMILRSELQLLVVWHGGGYDSAVALAVDQGVWTVLRTGAQLPAGFSGKLLRSAGKRAVGVFVWCPWMFVPSFESAEEWLVDQQVMSMQARCEGSEEAVDWPSVDRPLVALAYPSVFLAQNWFGLPERVFCREVVCPARDGDTPIQYHCSLSLIYEKAVVSVRGALNAGPDRFEVAMHGPAGAIELTSAQAHWYDRGGQLAGSSENYTTDQAGRIGYERCLGAVWQAYQERQRATAFEFRRHIATMGILDAAALSARTGGAEQLVKVAEVREIVDLG